MHKVKQKYWWERKQQVHKQCRTYLCTCVLDRVSVPISPAAPPKHKWEGGLAGAGMGYWAKQLTLVGESHKKLYRNMT
jgi:hypothetical protein